MRSTSLFLLLLLGMLLSQLMAQPLQVSFESDTIWDAPMNPSLFSLWLMVGSLPINMRGQVEEAEIAW